MEKYGVEECTSNTDQEKTAQETQRCPNCGSSICNPDSTGGVKLCPKCGTKPFEVE